MAHKYIVICDWCKTEKVNPRYWIDVRYRTFVEQDFAYNDYPINNFFNFCSNECMLQYIENVGIEKDQDDRVVVMSRLKGE